MTSSSFDLLAVDFQTGARLGLVHYSTLEWKEVLCDTGEWTAEIEAHEPSAGLLLPGRTLVYIHDSTARAIRFAGIVWRTRRRPESSVIEVSGSDLLGYLDRRLQRDYLDIVDEQLAIAKGLVDAMQAVAGGTLRLVIVRSPTSSGVSRNVIVEGLDTIGDTLRKMAQLDNGFEFRIVPAWGTGSTITHTLYLTYPRIGRDLNVVWSDGLDVVVEQSEDDYSDHATWFRARGGGDETAPTVDLGPTTQPVVARGFPVLDGGQTYSDLKTTAQLASQGTGDMRALHVETVTVALADATRYPLGTFAVGDSVRIVSPPPSLAGLDGSIWWRIGGYSASLDEDGQLSVSLDLDRARNNARPVLRPIDRLAAARAATQRRLALVENVKT